MEIFGFDDNKSTYTPIPEIGLILLVVAAFLYFFGIILFFARSLLLLSNVPPLTHRSSSYLDSTSSLASRGR